jgi:hypothetical protein
MDSRIILFIAATVPQFENEQDSSASGVFSLLFAHTTVVSQEEQAQQRGCSWRFVEVCRRFGESLVACRKKDQRTLSFLS